MTENKYITLNHHGTPVLAETNTNIVPIGVAHENGATEAQLIEHYGMTRAQLHAALFYFYEHREEIRAYQAETERLLAEHGEDIRGALVKIKVKSDALTDEQWQYLVKHFYDFKVWGFDSEHPDAHLVHELASLKILQISTMPDGRQLVLLTHRGRDLIARLYP